MILIPHYSSPITIPKLGYMFIRPAYYEELPLIDMEPGISLVLHS